MALPTPDTLDQIDKELGAKLKAFRIAAGKSQIALGAAVGISGTQLQKYENGSNRISASMLIMLCHALKRDPMAFMAEYFPDNSCKIDVRAASRSNGNH
ncbi:helix-turn-helix transcriptional regulator [Phyllobacterium sp. UNC302MFCol5.2]|uniref:helix-turn-helix domain-containing protein n=1 Tax=Phyllobacterium sp. UNC302MFCol5.2 TaxID=1449065 RepID=UPI0018CC6586|nr:helix-turn-helix transcriptional regulator [Phyllobacterium sp. UNC302MFCol5.2]